MHSLYSEWRALSDKIFPKLPFRTPDWNYLQWVYFGRNSVATTDELYVFSVRNADGELIGVAPMVLSTWSASRLTAFKRLDFFGQDPNITELRGPVCLPEDQPAVLNAVAKAIHAHKLGNYWVGWQGMFAPNNATSAAHNTDRALRSSPVGETPNYFLELPETWDAMRSSLPRNTKEALRKCTNSLKRDGHSYDLRILSTPDEIVAGLKRFYHLHRVRAEADLGTAHPNVFVKRNARQFLNAYAAMMAQSNSIRIFEIVVNGKAIASRIGFTFGDEIYLYYSGFEPEWAKYSIMTTLVSEIFQWSIKNKIRLVNLSFGTDRSKLRWRPAMQVYHSAIEVMPNLTSRVSYLCYKKIIDIRRRRVAAPEQTVDATDRKNADAA
jgi:CelD/BcsL family acetyltransferase involved in cellulose biosynthesis